MTHRMFCSDVLLPQKEVEEITKWTTTEFLFRSFSPLGLQLFQRSSVVGISVDYDNLCQFLSRIE